MYTLTLQMSIKDWISRKLSHETGKLISSEFPLVEVFRREQQGFWSLYTLGPGDTIELSSLGLRFPVAEVYLNTSFLEEGNG